jgi:hypothetical protein
VETTFATINYRIEPIVTTIEEPKSIRGGVELAIVSCILHLPQNLWKYLL